MGYKISKGFMWVREPKIPSEYQEVEYIQSSGTQYLIVGDTFKTSYKTVIDFQMVTTGGDYIPLGIIAANSYRYGINAYSSYFKVTSGSTTWSNTKSEDTNRHTITIDKSTATVDGTNYSINYTNATFNYGLGVFAYYAGTGSQYYSSNKLYKLDIYDENGNHIYDLVPCYRKSDSVIGLYDLVNSVFYTNAGSGTFTKGNDVAPTYVFKEKQFYPGSEGGYKPNANTLLYLPLDGDYLDKSSNHNDGTAVGTMSFGRIGNRQYASFGASSAIQLGTIPVGTGNPQPFTQSVWLKTTASGVGYMHHFGVDSSHSRSLLITFYSSNHIPLQDMYGSSYDTYIGSATTSDLWNKWINLVYTYENGTHKLYINGALRGTASNTINIGGTTNRYIGRIDASNGGYCMAECIFESVVWPAQEVLDYYNLTKSDFGL